RGRVGRELVPLRGLDEGHVHPTTACDLLLLTLGEVVLEPVADRILDPRDGEEHPTRHVLLTAGSHHVAGGGRQRLTPRHRVVRGESVRRVHDGVRTAHRPGQPLPGDQVDTCGAGDLDDLGPLFPQPRNDPRPRRPRGPQYGNLHLFLTLSRRSGSSCFPTATTSEGHRATSTWTWFSAHPPNAAKHATPVHNSPRRAFQEVSGTGDSARTQGVFSRDQGRPTHSFREASALPLISLTLTAQRSPGQRG